MEANRLIRHDRLNVGDGHKVYLAQYGNPQGLPVLFLHGGPGAGCYQEELSLFDLSRCRVLMLDQRGCGHSLPHGSLEQNDLQSLIADLETIRLWLGIDKWCLCGGSFGATLGFLYSGLYPQRVITQTYWGMFLPSKNATEWLYGRKGAAKHHPEAYRSFSQGLGTKATLDDLFDLYYRGMHHDELPIQRHFIHRWVAWEAKLAAPQLFMPFMSEERAETLAKTELHFARNGYFSAFELMTKCIENIEVSTLVLQGEKDWVCPPNFFENYQPWFSNSRLTCQIIAGGYHSLATTNMLNAVTGSLIEMAEKYG